MQKGFAQIIILLGIVIASVAGGGVYYFSKVKAPVEKRCPAIAKICPDGSTPERNRLTCEFAACPSPAPTEIFEPVTINQLITNMNKFENKKVSVKGIYAGQMTVQAMCVPTASDNTPRILEEYQFYPTAWVITEGKGVDTLGIKVLDKNNAVNSTLPNYKIREEIELKGTARTATVPDQCRSNIRYKSIYLEVKEEDVNLTSKGEGNDRIQIPDCNKGSC